MNIITMIGNIGTYLDSPVHRYGEGSDLAGLELASLVDLPTEVFHLTDLTTLGIPAEVFFDRDVRGKAVLLHTGDADRFGTPDYVVDPSYLTRAGADWLVAQGVALVGIDAANIDDMTDGHRPAHTQLLAAGIPIELARRCIRLSTWPGETVLDPFAGTGTTLLAARQLGRRAIGIEVSEAYCFSIVDRLAQRSFDFHGAA